MTGDPRTGTRAGLGMIALAGAALLVKGTPPVNPTNVAPTGSPVVSPTVPVTPDRLLEPTLPAKPGAADLGAQVFWLYCMPCHGDRGQGLTTEFRLVYPTEEQNCWASGCHGQRPYDKGFTLPTQVPPVIGEGALKSFASIASLSGFVRAAMPRQAPGSLSPEQYDQIIAFLARENGLPSLESAQASRAAPEGTATAEAVQHPLGSSGRDSLQGILPFGWWAAGAILLLALVVGFAFRRSRKRSSYK